MAVYRSDSRDRPLSDRGRPLVLSGLCLVPMCPGFSEEGRGAALQQAWWASQRERLKLDCGAPGREGWGGTKGEGV